MSNWIFDLFGSKDEIKKEAELTNKEKEWERKVQSNDWINDAMNIDEDALAKEATAKILAEERAAEPVDTVGLIMAFEQGDLDNDGILKLFSELIRTGQAWSLQGSYGRAAKNLIDQGYIDEQGNILKDVEASHAAPDAAEEQQDPDYTRRASKKSSVTKIAAFEKGDTAEDTNKKDYELKVSGLSDYNLAEMLAEYEAMEKGIATLSMNEYKEDALKSVKSGRDAAEKKLIKFLGTPAILDWKKAFKEMEDSEVKFAAEKDLFTEWKEGKMAWEKKEKFEATTEKEKLKQMDGVGGEEEKGQVGKEASLKEAATPVEIIEKKVDKLIKDTIDKKFEEMAPAAPVVDPMLPVDPMVDPMAGVPTVTEDSPEDKVLDKLDVPHIEPGETPEHEEKEIEKVKEDKPEEKKEDKKEDDKEEDDKEASLKTADELMDDVRENDPLQGKPAFNPFKDKKEEKEAAPEMGAPSATLPVDAPGGERGYHGWKNFESYMVAIWLDNDRELKARVEEMANASKDSAELASQLQSLVEESKPDLGATAFSDLINYSLSNVDWHEVAESLKSDDAQPESPEVNTPDDAKHPVAQPAEVMPEGAALQDIKPQASKKEVLTKIAEIDSPWKVVKNDKGEEIIARVAPAATTKKSKEKDKEHGINSQDLK